MREEGTTGVSRGHSTRPPAGKEELNWDERLLERIADPGNLRRAYRKVKSNGGEAGVDGMNIDDAAKWFRAHPGELRQSLLQRSYQPQDVRGKNIPKPNGGERKLGIPTVIDRIVQQAFVQVLTPILSPLLANVLLDDFDKEQERRGHKFCRYADDCIIMVRTIAAARRVLASVTRYLEEILKLKVNREKSKIVSAAECPYLR